MAEIITGLVLSCWAWQDARERSVSILALIVGGIVLLKLWVSGFWAEDFWMTDVLTASVPTAGWNRERFIPAVAGAVPGLLLLAAAFFPGAGIGAADGIVLLLLGLVTGMGGILCVLAYGMAAFAVCAVLFLVSGRITVRSRLPFLPFVLFGYLGVCLEMV